MKLQSMLLYLQRKHRRVEDFSSGGAKGLEYLQSEGSYFFSPLALTWPFRGTITSHYQGHNRSPHHLLHLFWRKLLLFLRSPCGVIHDYQSSAASRVHCLSCSLLVETICWKLTRDGDVNGLQHVQTVICSIYQFIQEDEVLAFLPWKKWLKIELFLQGGNRECPSSSIQVWVPEVWQIFLYAVELFSVPKLVRRPKIAEQYSSIGRTSAVYSITSISGDVKPLL